MARSPFALATPVAPGIGTQASFAMNWYVSGVGRLDGEDFVTIQSRDLSKRFSLFGHEPSGGVSLVGVEWSDRVGRSTVVIREGNQVARLEFNETAMQGPAIVAAAAGTKKAVVAVKPAGGTMVKTGKTVSTLPAQMQSVRSPGGAEGGNVGSLFPQGVEKGDAGSGQTRVRDRVIGAP